MRDGERLLGVIYELGDDRPVRDRREWTDPVDDDGVVSQETARAAYRARVLPALTRSERKPALPGRR